MENRLTLIKEINERSYDGRKMGLFQCSCGNTKKYPIDRVKKNIRKSCGCLKFDHSLNKKHGMKYTKEYRAWNGIKNRCLNPKDKNFKVYNKLGIEAVFIESFEEFYREIGPCPDGDYSIDRIDNTKGYFKGNIRWATRSQQQINKQNSCCVIADGIEYESLAALAKARGVTRTTVGKWVHGYFDKRRNKFEEPKKWIQVMPKYNKEQKNGKNAG